VTILREPITTTAATFAALGTIALASAVMPSPTRLKLFEDIPVSVPSISVPDAIKQKTFPDYSIIIEQPLFNSDRMKDPPEPDNPNATQRPALETYRLAGLITANQTKVALVERRDTKKIVELKIGDNLDGRIVKDITSAGVVFSGSGSEILAFPRATGANVGPIPAPSNATPTLGASTGTSGPARSGTGGIERK
jgi:hypothetical protein